MADGTDPSVQRRRIRTELRSGREAAGLTQQEAAKRLGWSESKLTRAEAGLHGVSERDLQAALALYRVTDPGLVAELTAAAGGSRRHSWWHPYRDVVSLQFAQLLGHESQAASVRVCHPSLIPSLLHTREYATTLMSFYRNQERVQEVIGLRMERQERLRANPEAEVIYVLGEEALHRRIGGPGVMRRQVERLLDAGQDPHVTIQVVPFTAGTHPGLQSPFTLLRLTEPEEEMLFIESVNGDKFVRDEPELTAEYAEYFGVMTSLALPPEEADALLREQAARLRRAEEAGADRAEGSARRP
jgi:transcriptional regulator with XRE-family HTH domain